MVEYRDIPNFLGYRAGTDGSVWSRWIKGPGSRLGTEWKLMKPAVRDDGRLLVNLRCNGKMHSVKVHRLILELFVGACPDGMECCHWDGNPQNNSLGNLRWATRRDNSHDRVRHGRGIGDRHPMAKLTSAAVRTIRALALTGMSKTEIARQCNVHPATVRRVVTRSSWKHVI